MNVNNPPHLSILMCVYNGEKYVTSAIESILQQSFSNFEFLIIDDGSEDCTNQIIGKFVDRDSRIRYFPRKHEGLTASLNFGLGVARGKYIVRQDADDQSTPDRLDTLVKNIGDFDMAVTAWANVYGEEEKIPFFSQLIINKYQKFLVPLSKVFNPFVHGTYMFRRTLALDLGGYDPNFLTAQDYDFFLRFTRKFRFKIIPFVGYRLRIHSGSISKKKSLEQMSFAVLAAARNFVAKRDLLSDSKPVPAQNPICELQGLFKTHVIGVGSILFCHLLRYRNREAVGLVRLLIRSLFVKPLQPSFLSFLLILSQFKLGVGLC